MARNSSTTAARLPSAQVFRRKAERRFREFLQRPGYPCLGARAAVNTDACIVQCYTVLGQNVSALARDLSRFIDSPLRASKNFATFVALFRRPFRLSEMEFERRLWSTLQQLNCIDEHAWDDSVASDPSSSDFAFSFRGLAFYIVGMHPRSSRVSRRFEFPTLVFNAHEQFRRLRLEGKWQRMRSNIRQRDLTLQGTHNPMLADFGERSEARQYSGRTVPENWKPPLKPARCPFAH